MARRERQSINRQHKRDFAKPSEIKMVRKKQNRYYNQLSHWQVQTVEFLDGIKNQKRSATDQAAFEAAYKVAVDREKEATT